MVPERSWSGFSLVRSETSSFISRVSFMSLDSLIIEDTGIATGTGAKDSLCLARSLELSFRFSSIFVALSTNSTCCLGEMGSWMSNSETTTSLSLFVSFSTFSGFSWVSSFSLILLLGFGSSILMSSSSVRSSCFGSSSFSWFLCKFSDFVATSFKIGTNSEITFCSLFIRSVSVIGISKSSFFSKSKVTSGLTGPVLSKSFETISLSSNVWIPSSSLRISCGPITLTSVPSISSSKIVSPTSFWNSCLSPRYHRLLIMSSNSGSFFFGLSLFFSGSSTRVSNSSPRIVLWFSPNVLSFLRMSPPSSIPSISSNIFLTSFWSFILSWFWVSALGSVSWSPITFWIWILTSPRPVFRGLVASWINLATSSFESIILSSSEVCTESKIEEV